MANKPVVLGCLVGSEPALPSIILNSHYDVVPVMAEHWCCNPFSGDLRDGYVGAQVPPELAAKGEPCVYGRGTQDMKCVCVQYLAALKRLRAADWQPRRTVHLTFMVREREGGDNERARGRGRGCFCAVFHRTADCLWHTRQLAKGGPLLRFLLVPTHGHHHLYEFEFCFLQSPTRRLGARTGWASCSRQPSWAACSPSGSRSTKGSPTRATLSRSFTASGRRGGSLCAPKAPR